MPNSFLRRYTPPTCTLEIAAKGSPLSRWTDRPVLKQLRFELSFDDPRLPSDRQVRLYGDRSQLDALCDAVDAYVQQMLGQPTWGELPSSASDSAVRSNGLPAPVSVLVPDAGFVAEPQAAPANRFGEHHPIALPADAEGAANPAGIQLTPQGLLSHDLWLGTLANEESGEVIRLSAVQLFDLATALDDYATEMLSLPELERAAWRQSPRVWLPVAAAAVLAIGVTGTLTKFVLDVSNPAMQTATAPAPEAASAPAVSALPPSPRTVPPPTPQFAPPTPLQGQPLPSPPPAGVAAAKPGLPAVTVPRSAPTTGAAPAPAVIQPNQPPQTAVQVPTQPSADAPPAVQNNSSPAAAARTEPTLPGIIPPETAALSQPAPAAEPTNPGTAFDTIPQVAEARSYFEERWQPPEGLSQTLEYRLVLQADGTIERIIPLGQAAGTFVDRSEIPLVGEPFVSPLSARQSAQIRLVLSPDGRVRTFLEE